MRGDRRRAQLEAEARAQHGPRWTCRLDGCPQAHTWQPAASPKLAEVDAARHYRTEHYNPDPPYTLRGLDPNPRPARPLALPPPRPLGSPPTARQQRPRLSAWDDRTEDTWIDRM